VAEKGATKSLLRELRACLEDGDALLGKRALVADDEARYAEMNARFHSLILGEAGSAIVSEAFERNARVPFAGPQALAFDSGRLDAMYDMLQYAHRQHHGIVDALERGEGARVEALMREHAMAVKESINLAALPVAAADSAARRLPAR
jgi:GntR family transcriptional regulator of vanillate catabolism